MKIVYLTDDFPPKSFGGAGIIAFNIAKAVKNKGHNVFIITTTQKKEEEGVFEYEGLKIYKIYSNYHERWRAYVSIYNFFVIKKVERILAEIKPDIIHVHNIHYYLSYYSLVISKKYAKGVFLTAHDAMLFAYGKIKDEIGHKVNILRQILDYKFRYNPFRNFFIKKYLKNIDKIFVVSSSLNVALNNNNINNTEIISNGIDVKNWVIEHKKLDLFKKKYNFENKKVILFGGRLSGLKGGEVVIEAMKKIVEKNNKIMLMIVGQKNNFAEKMLARAGKLRIENNILFTGWIDHDDIKYVYAVSDIVVVASLYLDPFPTINLEAMACKKPVVGTIFGGTKEVVQDGVTGYILDPNNITELSGKILDLLNDDEKIKRFSGAGYNRVKINFSEDEQVKKILLCYNNFLNKLK